MRISNLPLTLFLFFYFFLSSILLFGQDGVNADYQSIDEVYSKNLRFPQELLGQSGRVILSIQIDEGSAPDSIFLIESSEEGFTTDVIRVTNLLIQEWKSEYLENRPSDESYLIVTTFNSIAGSPKTVNLEEERVQRFLEKKKYDKAMNLLNTLIADEPYQASLYEQRSQAHRELGHTEEAQRDYMTYKQIRKKVLAHPSVTAFGVRR